MSRGAATSGEAARGVVYAAPTAALSGDTKGTWEWHDAALVDEAIVQIRDGDLDGAEAVLRAVAVRVPRRYNVVAPDRRTWTIRCWSLEEYVHTVTQNPHTQTKWSSCAYPRVCFYLAYLCRKRGDYPMAIAWIDAALPLQRHALLCLEKAATLARLGRHLKALELFDEVATSEQEIPRIRARARRGAGYMRIATGELGLAEQLLRASLELEPDNPVALRTLDHLAHPVAGATVDVLSALAADDEPVEPTSAAIEGEVRCARCGKANLVGARVDMRVSPPTVLCAGCLTPWWRFWRR